MNKSEQFLEKIKNASPVAKEVIESITDIYDEAKKTLTQRAKVDFNNSESSMYENRTKEDLYALAKEKDIEGRSYMSKSELITALRVLH
jgi:DNA primase large subunit